MPQLADRRRETVISRLPGALRGGIARREAARDDLIEIVRACLDHDGGLRHLAAAIAFVAPGSISAKRACEALLDLDRRRT